MHHYSVVKYELKKEGGGGERKKKPEFSPRLEHPRKTSPNPWLQVQLADHNLPARATEEEVWASPALPLSLAPLAWPPAAPTCALCCCSWATSLGLSLSLRPGGRSFSRVLSGLSVVSSFIFSSAT